MAFIVEQLSMYFLLTLSLLLTPPGNKDIQLEVIRPGFQKIEFLTASPVQKGFIVYKGQGPDKKELFKIYEKSKNSLIFNIYDKSFKTLDQINLSGLKNVISREQRYISLQTIGKDNISRININIKPDKQCLYFFMSNHNGKMIVRVNGNYESYKIPANLIKMQNKKTRTKCKNVNVEFRFAEAKYRQGLEKRLTVKNQKLYLHKESVLTGKHIDEIEFQKDGIGRYVVAIKFNQEGRKIFADLIRKNQGKKLVVIANDKLLSAPVIQDPIPYGKVEISSGYSYHEAAKIFNTLCGKE